MGGINMKQVIRNQTFETNSSSMHSLCIVKDPVPYEMYNANLDWDNYDKFHLFGTCSDEDEYLFERAPFRVLNTPIKKLRYWVAFYVGRGDKKEVLDDVLKLVQKVTGLPNDKIILTTPDYDEDDEYSSYPYGYASINDTGEDPLEYIEKNNITMEEFVMDPKYIIIIDGDEYCEFSHLIKSGVVNLDSFEYISSGKDYWDPRVDKLYINWFRNDNIFNDSILPVMEYAKNYKKMILEDDGEPIDLTNLQTWYNYVFSICPDIELVIQTNRQQLFLDADIVPSSFEVQNVY